MGVVTEAEKEESDFFFPKERVSTHEESLSNDAQHVSTVFAERELFFFSLQRGKTEVSRKKTAERLHFWKLENKKESVH